MSTLFPHIMKTLSTLNLVLLAVAVGGIFYFNAPHAALEQRSSLTANINDSAQTEGDLVELLETVESLEREVNGISVKAGNSTVINTQGSVIAAGGTPLCFELKNTFKKSATDEATQGEVSKLQQFLKSIGLLNANVTGFYGEQTETALIEFQKRNRLVSATFNGPATVGQLTRQKIKELSCGGAVSGDMHIATAGPTGGVTIESDGIVSGGRTENINFGYATGFDDIEKTVKVKVPEGITASYVSIAGLETPFDFKGGQFPGTGGTCRESLRNDCTMVFTFSPRERKGEFILSASPTYRTRSVLYLNYRTENETLKTNEVLLFGTLNAATAELTIAPSNLNFHPLLMGLPQEVKLQVQNVGRGAYKITEVVPPKAPFKLTNNTCVDSITECIITIAIDTPAPGEYSDSLEISYNTGLEHKTAVFPLKIEIFGNSDTALTPEKNLLVVYNTLSNESKQIKDYYIANRPGFKNANVLGVAVDDSVEPISRPNFEAAVVTPVYNWIKSNTDKTIKHVVFVRGIPRRVGPGKVAMDTMSGASVLSLANTTKGACDQYQLPIWSNFGAQFEGSFCDRKPIDVGFSYTNPEKNYFFSPKTHPGTLALVTYLDMGSQESTIAYVDKLKAMYQQMPEPSLFISAQNTGEQGDTYYIEDTGNQYSDTWGSKINELLKAGGARTEYHSVGGNQIASARDVLGFFSWGANAGRGQWYSLGFGKPITFSGNSGWYIIQTAESYNGQLTGNLWQGKFSHWFSKTAFGGSNYENTPVGAVAHVDEPTLAGINHPIYFGCWDKGNLFIDCAWMSKSAVHTIVIGDPWVRK